MKKLTIYSKPNCPYCEKAKYLLEQKNIPFEDINIMNDMEYVKKLRDMGLMTVPQIFLGDKLFVEGGYDGLSALTDEEIAERMEKVD